jgi:putative flippase GtrA
MRMLILQLARFGLVGLAGLLVNIAAVYLLRLVVDLLLSAAIAFLIAATATWLLNRNFTFREVRKSGMSRVELSRQWGAFIVANAFGGIIYLGTFWCLTSHVPICREFPALAVCAGGAMGMIVNFLTSRSFVFVERSGVS